ncbi:Zinc finger protein 782 [Eumeta japonica]|uniref:Zinc finger protein 782 n=1 Tax=Eumeta variegata TaxID=151549 RepID=A0A4C1VVG4_EUMVA|nr:Zinc finger protein 782 [Eumeta japonica]
MALTPITSPEPPNPQALARPDFKWLYIRKASERERKSASATKADRIRVTRKRKSAEELGKQQYNLLSILQLSNATTLRSKTGKGFNCAFCSEVFAEPADLKMHNIKEHKDVKPKAIMNKKILYGNYVKLDVTALECSLCGSALEMLPDLMEHLKHKHGKRLYTDIEDRILPFKFDSVDVTRCVVCSAEFVSFNMLQRHMNAHYRNHVCEECDAGFVNKRLLRHHMKYTHQLGEFRCNFCEKVFGTKSKRNDHEKSVHFGFKRNKCAYCSERFVCYKKRNKHVVDVHNKPPIVYKCHACDKVFDMRYKLSQHTKKDHLMERKHECDVCEMKFFMKKELEKHMVKHSGEKNFTCQVCLKTYARKNTLREHMRIHANDRRFKCDKCSHAFVQKCAWRSHMRTKHDVTV